MASLQTASDDTLLALAIVEGPDVDVIEKRVHASLRRQRHRGEWFNITPQEAVRIATDMGGRVLADGIEFVGSGTSKTCQTFLRLS